jgi:hypothetical protein
MPTIKDLPTKLPTKRVVIEFVGGGDADGIVLDSALGNSASDQQSLIIYQMSLGGKPGYSCAGASAGNIRRMLKGENLDMSKMGGQSHYSTVVERQETDDALYLKVQYTAGLGTFAKGDDPTLLVPNWVNTAIWRFIDKKFPQIDLNEIISFWIGRDVQSDRCCTVERKAIEEHYEGGTIEAKCDAIADAIQARDKVATDFDIADDVIRFRKRPTESVVDPS